VSFPSHFSLLSLGVLTSYSHFQPHSIGTTHKGIGPAYSSKASRSGLRVHHLYSPEFPDKFRKLVEGRFKRYGHFEYDTEAEIKKYLVSIRSRWAVCLSFAKLETESRFVYIQSQGPRRTSPTLHRRRTHVPSQSHRREQTNSCRGCQRSHARSRLRDISLRHVVGHLDWRCLYRSRYPTDNHQEGHWSCQGLYY
jgi:hypothetical protein